LSKYSSYFFTAVILLLTAFMLINPRETVIAASLGFQLWYSTVLPALFPFFIVAELLFALHFVNQLGIWLEPIMRPVFRLPGCSSLVLVMGFTSGFPVGAILTRKLYDKKMLTADEAERLVSFTNNSSPLFIMGAIGVGMFANPAAGYLLASSHYLSNLLLGLLWRFKAPRPKLSGSYAPAQLRQGDPVFAPTNASNENIASMGKILGDAIKNALNNILTVGGFIVIFSVLTRMLAFWGFIDIMAAGLVNLFTILHLSYPLAYGLSMGFFEITMGARTAISASDPETLPTLLIVSSILAFSGLSIIAQIMSIVAGTPVRLSFYLWARALQVLLSGAITCVVYRLFLTDSISTMGFAPLPIYKILYSFNAWAFSLYSMLLGIILILIMLGLAWCKKY
jgi:sporulation integral membrane protein YlbJ